MREHLRKYPWDQTAVVLGFVLVFLVSVAACSGGGEIGAPTSEAPEQVDASEPLAPSEADSLRLNLGGIGRFHLAEATIAAIRGALQRRECTCGSLIRALEITAASRPTADIASSTTRTGTASDPTTTFTCTERKGCVPRRGRGGAERGQGQRHPVGEPAAGALHAARVRPTGRSGAALRDRSRGRRSEPPRRDRDGRRARSRVRRDRRPPPAAMRAHRRREGPDGDHETSRTTDGSLTEFQNDRPPNDGTLVAKLRDAGAIILAKANMDEYASGKPPQLVRRPDLQPVRDRSQRRQLEHRIGRGGVHEPGGLRHRRGIRRFDSRAERQATPGRNDPRRAAWSMSASAPGQAELLRRSASRALLGQSTTSRAWSTSFAAMTRRTRSR